MRWTFAPRFESHKDQLLSLLAQWQTVGSWWVQGPRNGIKVIPYEDMSLSVKIFKVPVWLNAIVYGKFRKSKARRSFEYALQLQSLGIGTPEPIGYAEHNKWWGLRESFYVCRHLRFDWMFRDLVEHPEKVPNQPAILQAFGAFCYEMHQKGIEFLDHSPGNTLICNEGAIYRFYLVDLNRMRFNQHMNLKTRMKNLSHLTPHRDMVHALAEAYAQASGEDVDELNHWLWHYTHRFQTAYYRKKRWKKRLFFWK